MNSLSVLIPSDGADVMTVFGNWNRPLSSVLTRRSISAARGAFTWHLMNYLSGSCV